MCSRDGGQEDATLHPRASPVRRSSLCARCRRQLFCLRPEGYRHGARTRDGLLYLCLGARLCLPSPRPSGASSVRRHEKVFVMLILPINCLVKPTDAPSSRANPSTAAQYMSREVRLRAAKTVSRNPCRRRPERALLCPSLSATSRTTRPPRRLQAQPTVVDGPAVQGGDHGLQV